MSKRILHFVITPFMIASKKWLNYFKTESKKDILNDKLLLPRIKSFATYYTYWNKIQVNKNFFVFILIDDELDEKYIYMLKDSIKEFDNIYIVKNREKFLSSNYYMDYETQKLNSKYNNFKKLNDYIGEIVIDGTKIHMLKNFDYFITTRTDDDNILDKNAIDIIQQNCSGVELDLKIFGFEYGYILIDKIYHFKYPEFKNRIIMSSIGLSLIMKMNNENITNSFNIYFAHHGQIMESLKKISNNKSFFKNPINEKDLRYYYKDKVNRSWIYNNKLSFTGTKGKNLKLSENEIKDFKDKFGESSLFEF